MIYLLFQKNWIPIEFYVNEIYFIHRKDYNDPFSIYYRIPFGNESIEIIKEIEEMPNDYYKVMIKNLPSSIDEKKLYELFFDFTPVSIYIPKKFHKTKKKFAFILFSDEQKIEKVISNFSKKIIEGKEIEIIKVYENK
jgi:RNA recognition motif-containing protein